MNGWLVYILKCADGTLYTGITNDVARRLAAHREGTASKYTRARRPVSVVYQEEQASRAAASKREAGLKRLTHREKCDLIRGVSPAAPPEPSRGSSPR